MDRRKPFRLLSVVRVAPISQGGLTVIFSRTTIAKSVRRAMLAGILLLSGWDNISKAFAQDMAEQASAPLILRSTLENLSRGFIPAGLPPALRIKSVRLFRLRRFLTTDSSMTRWRFSKA